MRQKKESEEQRDRRESGKERERERERERALISNNKSYLRNFVIVANPASFASMDRSTQVRTTGEKSPRRQEAKP
jgi:hypothetical protein